MTNFERVKPWLRNIVAAMGVSAIVGGITFAALQSQQAILAGNTIDSATASLQLSIDGGNYANTQPGFAFTGLIPGGPAMPTETNGKPLWFKNNGSAPLSLQAMIINAPTTTGDIDLNKVFVVFTPVSGGTAQSVSVASLVAGATHGGVQLNIPALGAGNIVQYHIQVSMSADAFSSNTASIRDLNLAFSGNAYIAS